MKITFLGHASLLVETASHSLLVDPFISGNEKAKGKIKPEDLHPDFILLTHAHQDHTLDAEAIARKSGARIISNFEIVSHYEKKGLNGHPMNHGGQWEFEFGTLKYVPAIHTSSFDDGSYGGQPGGFVLKSGGKTIYIAGDTSLTMDMKLIAMTHRLDLAVLPIGDNFTMGYADARLAAEFVECDKILGYHFDTFGYIEIDHAEAKKAFAESGRELILLEIGDSLVV